MAERVSSAGHKLILPGQNMLDTSPPIEERDGVAVDTPEMELLSVLTEGRPLLSESWACVLHTFHGILREHSVLGLLLAPPR